MLRKTSLKTEPTRGRRLGLLPGVSEKSKASAATVRVPWRRPSISQLPIRKVERSAAQYLISNGDLVPGATATLEGLGPSEKQMTTANDFVAFEFRDVKLGVVYHARVTADAFNEWIPPRSS